MTRRAAGNAIATPAQRADDASATRALEQPNDPAHGDRESDRRANIGSDRDDQDPGQRVAAEPGHASEQPGQPLPDDVSAEAHSVLVELEMLAGVESPAADLDLRRSLQIERLSTRMRGTQSAGVTEQLDALLARWTDIGAAPAGTDARFERALLAAIESLP